jgi:hypothetical protein
MLKDESPYVQAAQEASSSVPSSVPCTPPRSEAPLAAMHKAAAGLPSLSLSARRDRINDQPSVDDVRDAMLASPWVAPASPRAPYQAQQRPQMLRQLSSPRRATPLGQTNHHASPWPTQSFQLDCPYGMTTADSRFADAEADRAALEAVALTAGQPTAAPVAGMSSALFRASKELPSLRREVSNGALP